MRKKVLVTSALPYANGPLHIGHIAGAYLPADIYTRFKRLKGDEVIHICGTDEHGVAITIAAEKAGKSPEEIVDFYYHEIKTGFQRLGIDFDNFSRTSKTIHHQNSQKFFLRVYERGYIYKKELEQLYCPHCKRFLPDRYVVGTCPYCGYEHARGDQCEKCGRWLEPTELINPRCAICGSTPIAKKTYHYYFKLSQFAEPLCEWLESKTHWKDNVRQTALSWIRDGLRDRAITRDLEWGVKVPLPEATDKVLYVWFDAPIGYISSTIEWAVLRGRPDEWKDWWMNPDVQLVHFIGKDNIVFHALVWPAMLMAHGDYILPSDIPANEFMNLMGRKLSTSRGWAIWVNEFLDTFPADYLRYGIAAILPESKDADFDYYDFKTRINSELADNLGNFVNRTLSFIKKYMGGRVSRPSKLNDIDNEALAEIEKAGREMAEFIEKFEFRKALWRLMELSSFGNRYFDRKAPWSTRKTDPEETARTLYVCESIVRSLSTFMEPYLPFSADKVRKMLNLEDKLSWDEAMKPDPAETRELGEIEILYRKLDDEIIELEVKKLYERAEGQGKPAPKAESGPEAAPKKEVRGTNVPEKEGKKMAEEKKDIITYEEFAKMDIRIAKVLEAEKIEGTDKLLKLTIDLGSEQRTLVAGIAQQYSPEDIVGKLIPVIVNLKPRRMRGVTSQGMMLAAVTDDGKIALLHPNQDVTPGTKIS